MNISFEQLKAEFFRVLLAHGFTNAKAGMIAEIFAGNSRDGVYTHGLNRFPVFIQYIKDGLIDIHAEPVMTSRNGLIETWDGQLAPGVYNASLAMQRAVQLAKENGIGVVSLKNTNHWMRGGTYGWQAADAGCIGICTTNTIALMPPWGGSQARLGNNPLVIAIPRKAGHIVLDMAVSQFSFGKMQEYKMAGKELPVAGGYNKDGALTTDPTTIMELKSPLPIGYWKGSGLSLMIDLLVAGLSGGRTVADITAGEKETGVCQLFIAMNAANVSEVLVDQVIEFTKNGSDGNVRYPGEHTLASRLKSISEGIPVNDLIWEQVLKM